MIPSGIGAITLERDYIWCISRQVIRKSIIHPEIPLLGKIGGKTKIRKSVNRPMTALGTICISSGLIALYIINLRPYCDDKIMPALCYKTFAKYKSTSRHWDWSMCLSNGRRTTSTLV